MTDIAQAKWCIVCGFSEGPEGFALSELSARLEDETGVPPVCVPPERFETYAPGHNLILLGTVKSNALLRRIISDPPVKPESFIVRTVSDPAVSEHTILCICGADTNGVLYGVFDFIHFFADRLAFPADYRSRRVRPFSEPLPPIDHSSCPEISKRGIWTWGRCIYDYRKFIDNMARSKFNTAVIWNDAVPVNGREIVRYAHSRGVRVIWGFSWGWGAGELDLSDSAKLDFWKKRVLEDYEKYWAPLGGDGIYFQTATECDEKEVGGEPLAKAVVRWVNTIADELLARHPSLYIEFGLHATSVRTSTRYLAGLDPRLTITWEDGGAFPYAYLASQTEGYGESLELTRKMLKLRGSAEKAGFVFKGVSTLFWPEFKPASGGFVLGEASEDTISRKLEKVRPTIRNEQAYWISNLGLLTELVREIAASGVGTGSVTLLCEDGCFERRRWYPCALFAETLWSPEKDPAEVLRTTALCRDVDFA